MLIESDGKGGNTVNDLSIFRRTPRELVPIRRGGRYSSGAENCLVIEENDRGDLALKLCMMLLIFASWVVMLNFVFKN